MQARGCSYYFNAAATFEFLAHNQLLSMLRAHEYEDEGFMFHFSSEEFQKLDSREDKSMPPLITVFSAPNYCDSYGNTVRCPYLLFLMFYHLQFNELLVCAFVAETTRLPICSSGMSPFHGKFSRLIQRGILLHRSQALNEDQPCGDYLTKHYHSFQPARSFSRRFCGWLTDRELR